MTFNSTAPMKSFQDGPRSVSGHLDAAIDARSYRLDYVITGPGVVEHQVRMLTSTSFYTLRFDGTNVKLSKTVSGVKTTLATIPGGYGAWALILDGSTLTVLRANGSTVFVAHDSSVPTGLRTQYNISGGATVTTVGRLL